MKNTAILLKAMAKQSDSMKTLAKFINKNKRDLDPIDVYVDFDQKSKLEIRKYSKRRLSSMYDADKMNFRGKSIFDTGEGMSKLI